MLLITKNDLLDAIAKCQGQTNPNANTCIKLAAYYTILDHTPDDSLSYAYSSEPLSEFLRIASRKNSNEVMLIMDDLMEELQGKNPKLYYAIIDRMEQLK